MTYTNTIEHHNGETIEVKSFDSLKEAKKEARKTVKQYELINHAGHRVNYKKHLELFTNY